MNTPPRHAIVLLSLLLIATGPSGNAQSRSRTIQMKSASSSGAFFMAHRGGSTRHVRRGSASRKTSRKPMGSKSIFREGRAAMAVPNPEVRPLPEAGDVEELGDAEAKVLKSVSTKEKAVALTIDLGEGLDRESLLSILDFLNANRLHATFFITGWFIRTYPELLLQIHRRGHDLANHTDTHPHCRTVSSQRLQEELAKVEQQLNAYGLKFTSPRLWRPPFGEYSSRTVHVAAEAGYRTVTWSATSLDYEPRTDPSRAAQTILKHVRPGGIILCHATPVSEKAIPQVVAKLQSESYQIETIRELQRDATDALSHELLCLSR